MEKILLRKIYTDKELNYIRDNYKNMTYKEITEKLNEFNEIKKTEKQVRTKASVIGLSKQKHVYNRRFFQNIDSEVKAYWLGFIFADGWISFGRKNDSIVNAEVGIELHKRDKSHLEKFVNHLNGNVEVLDHLQVDREIKGVFVKGGTYSSLLRLYSVEMARDLVRNGVVENKTYKDDYPLIEDSELFVHFLRGFMDGDGCISVTSNSRNVHLTNANLKFLEHVQCVLSEKFNIESKTYKEYETKYRLNFNRLNGEKLLNLLYSNCSVYLDRKILKSKEYLQKIA